MSSVIKLWKCSLTNRETKETYIGYFYASTILGAKRMAFQKGFNDGADPDYSTLELASTKEEKELKKKIKEKIKNK